MTLTLIAPLALAASSLLAGPVAHQPDAGEGARLVAAATPYWAPPESARKKKKPRPHATEVRSAETQAHAASTATLEAEVFGEDADDDTDGAAGTLRRQARPAMDDEDSRPTVLPVIAPRLLSLALGAALVGRSFGFNTQLQGENAFPRAGMVAALETFPFAFLHNFVSRLGFAGSIEREIGSAAVGQADGGSLGYPVSEGRWSADVRYAFFFGQRFVLMPLAGIGHSGYDVERRTETTPPSQCMATATQVCLPDSAVSHLTFGVNGRIAIGPAWGLSVGAAVLPAFGVGRARGQLGVEAAPSALGYSAEVGVAWQLLDWLNVRASVPVERYGYSWSGPTVPYRSASETYYSLVVGATAFTK
jgi:hypothetical protein